MQINTFVKNFLNLGQICCELFWVFSISVITIFAANRRSVNGQQCSSSSVVAWRSQLIVLCFVTVTSRLQSAVGTALCSDGWWLIRNIFTKYFFLLLASSQYGNFFFFLPNCRVFFVYRDVMNSETWTTLRTLNSYNKSLKHRLKYVWIMWRNNFWHLPFSASFTGCFYVLLHYSNANVGPRCIFLETINCL